MKILAIDTSGTVAAVAVGTEEKLLASYLIDDKLTHSEKLFPMIDTVLNELHMSIDDIECFASVIGPGSFTGLRIGVAAVKGMACGRPVVPITSTMAMAYGFYGSDINIMPLIDARNENVYCGEYRFENGEIKELQKPTAIDVKDLKISAPTVFMGDGSIKYREILEKNKNARFAPTHIVMSNGSNVYAAACDMIKKGMTVSANELLPLYIKKCQAEREKERENEK